MRAKICIFFGLLLRGREVIIESQVSLPSLGNESIHSTSDEAPRYARQAQTMIPVINADAKRVSNVGSTERPVMYPLIIS